MTMLLVWSTMSKHECKTWRTRFIDWRANATRLWLLSQKCRWVYYVGVLCVGGCIVCMCVCGCMWVYCVDMHVCRCYCLTDTHFLIFFLPHSLIHTLTLLSTQSLYNPLTGCPTYRPTHNHINPPTHPPTHRPTYLPTFSSPPPPRAN